MLTTEEMEQLVKERPESVELIKQMIKLGIDPMAGMGFAKEYIDTMNGVKYSLEKKYGVNTDVVVKLTIIGKRGKSEESAISGFNTGG